MAATAIAGSSYAFKMFTPAAPALRVRYRHGVAVDPYGFPDWLPYARAVLEVPPVTPGQGVDETRVRDVLTANHAMAEAGDPLWEGLPPGGTPAGWTWAHLARGRRVALVPAELHGSFRHLGGVSTLRADRGRRGLPIGSGGAGSPSGPSGGTIPPGSPSTVVGGPAAPTDPPPVRHLGRLAPDLLDAAERRLGVGLPPAYRRFLGMGNGGPPERPAVHPGFGFVVDQPFFGLARADRAQDLLHANQWLADRLTREFLAIGHQQGGLLVVRVAGPDRGSVWFLDNDDHRDRDEYVAADVCQRLLRPVAADFDRFWSALREPPAEWLVGAATPVELPGLGAWLPVNRRAGAR